MDYDIIHKIRNDTTEHEEDYKRLNLKLEICYSGLDPVMYKLSSISRNFILNNKKYDTKKRNYGPVEKRRIYNNQSVVMEDILRNYYPRKYIGGKDPSKDASNMLRNIKALHDNNIFYYWKPSYQPSFMFFMERDYGCWKFYNENGVVTPKTMNKILVLTKDIINSMISFGVKINKSQKPIKVLEAFVVFVDKMIKKMNPIVAQKLPIWNGIDDPKSYLCVLFNEMKLLHEYEGLSHSVDFLKLLPPTIGTINERKIMKESENDTVEMEKALIASDPNLGNISKKIDSIDKKKKASKPKEVKVKLESWKYTENINPFKNGRKFVEYYRAYMINSSNEKSKDYKMEQIKFENMGIDAKTATEILDLLSDSGRNNHDFLKAWFSYYLDKELIGIKITTPKYTSLVALKKTFDKFNQVFCA